MPPFVAKVRYRYGEGGGGRDASFYGLFFDRSDRAVLRRLEEAHRFADWVEVVDARWGESAAATGEGGRRGRQYSAPLRLAPLHGGGAWGGGGAWDDALKETRHRDAPWSPRRHARCGMFKPAYLVTDGGVLDCVLLDLSPGGARVCLLAPAELPDFVTLWVPGVGSRPFLRRWRRGPQIGLEAVKDTVRPS